MSSVVKKGLGTDKSVLIAIDAEGQEVLERAACKVTAAWVEARIYGGLPAAGRRILGLWAEAMLCDLLPRVVEQLVDFSQARAVGMAIHPAVSPFMDGKATLKKILEKVDSHLDTEGLDSLDPFHRYERHPGNFARARRLEIAAANNRLRTVRFASPERK